MDKHRKTIEECGYVGSRTHMGQCNTLLAPKTSAFAEFRHTATQNSRPLPFGKKAYWMRAVLEPQKIQSSACPVQTWEHVADMLFNKVRQGISGLRGITGMRFIDYGLVYSNTKDCGDFVIDVGITTYPLILALFLLWWRHGRKRIRKAYRMLHYQDIWSAHWVSRGKYKHL